jgi:hypothetical protein
VGLEADTRPVSKQVLSGLKISAVLVAALITSLVLMSFIPVRRIEAFYWHWRHGTSIDVGSYRFPVPKQWYVTDLSTDDFLLVDLDNGDSISVRMSPRPGRFTLAAWEALITRPMLDGNTKILGRKELQISGETILCVEKNLDTKAVRIYPIECRSESALEVTFHPNILATTDHNQMFYSLLQQVQKL